MNKTLIGATVLAWMVSAGCDVGRTGGDGPDALAVISGFMGGTVTGTGEFAKDGTSVTLTLTLDGCVDALVYPVHIHEGASCADAIAQGGHWDMTRGEGIPMITCTGTSGTGTVTRSAADPATTGASAGT